MNKELTPLEAYNELKSYLEDILNCTCNSNAMRHTDSFMYLLPFIKQVETALKDYEQLKIVAKPLTDEEKKLINSVARRLKALEIIKEKRVDTTTLYVCFRKYGNSGLGVYNDNVSAIFGEKRLIQEEFDLLKEVLK